MFINLAHPILLIYAQPSPEGPKHEIGTVKNWKIISLKICENFKLNFMSTEVNVNGKKGCKIQLSRQITAQRNWKKVNEEEIIE